MKPGLQSYQSYRLPAWAIVTFVVAMCAVYAPGIVFVYGIHNSYDALIYKNEGLFHADALRLFEFARPVAGLFSNLTVLPLERLQDLRWTRIFALLTVCALGVQLMSLCVTHLRTGQTSALLVSLAVFLTPAFTYSILEPAAWTPHLLTILFILLGYRSLSRTNIPSINFLVLFSQRAYGDLCRHALVYLGQRRVLIACGYCQLAFYDYPPMALILTIFPVIALLYSQWPQGYRRLLAIRDIFFVGINTSVFYLSAKLVYLPAVRFFVDPKTGQLSHPYEGDFAQKVGNTYEFKLETSVGLMVDRLQHLSRAAGDLWFLPQMKVHIAVALALLICVVISAVPSLARQAIKFAPLKLEPSRFLPVDAVLMACCFSLAAATTIAPIGAIISYRTIVVPTIVVALSAICAVGMVVRILSGLLGNSCSVACSRALMAKVALVGGGLIAMAYANDVTMTLARNEFRYYSALVGQAMEHKSAALVIIDPRPIFLSEDIPELVDEEGRWLPPYDLGCFSGYCLPSQAALRVAQREKGYSKKLFLWTPRHNDPVLGITCDMLTSSTALYPAGASPRAIKQIDYVRTLKPITCVNYDIAWHDLKKFPSQ